MVVVSGTGAWEVRGSPSASEPGTGIRPTRPLTPPTWIGAQRAAYKLSVVCCSRFRRASRDCSRPVGWGRLWRCALSRGRLPSVRSGQGDWQPPHLPQQNAHVIIEGGLRQRWWSSRGVLQGAAGFLRGLCLCSVALKTHGALEPRCRRPRALSRRAALPADVAIVLELKYQKARASGGATDETHRTIEASAYHRFRRAYGAALALTPAPIAAQQWTPEQRAACEPDAMRLCNQYVPDVQRVSACMSLKRRYLSPACRAVFRGGAKRRSR